VARFACPVTRINWWLFLTFNLETDLFGFDRYPTLYGGSLSFQNQGLSVNEEHGELHNEDFDPAMGSAHR
jgi:hypothetical protein